MASLGIGPVLRHERLRQNLDVDDISRQTRIAARFIEAIEAEDFACLPAAVFTRGFVRQYAAALSLDAESLVAALPKPDIENAPLPVPPPRPRREKWDPRVKSAVQAALFLLAAAGAGTMAWWRFNQGSYFSFDSLRPTPVSWAAKATVPAPTQTVEVAAAPVVPVAAVNSTEVPRTTDAEIPQPSPVAVAATPATPRAVEVTVAARQVSWVQITADGRQAFSGMLKPSDVRTVGANGTVKVLAGNAGGVDISLNGRKLDPLGPEGQVRSVMLTAEGPQPAPQTQPPSQDQF